MKKQTTTTADLGAAAAASNGHIKGFQQYSTPIAWARALAAGLPYRRYSVVDLFAGHGSLLQGIANESTREIFSLELDPDCRPFRRQGSHHHFLQGDFNDWLPLAMEVGLQFDLITLNPPFSLRWPNEGALRKGADTGNEIDSTLASIRTINLLMSDHVGEGMLIGNFSTLQRLRRQHAHDFRHVWLSVRLPSFFPGVKIEVGVLYFAKWFDRTKASSERSLHPVWTSIDSTDPDEVKRELTRLSAPAFRWNEIQEFFQRNGSTLDLWDAVSEETIRRRQSIASGNHNLEVDPLTGLLRTWVTKFQTASSEVAPEIAKALKELNRQHPLELVLQKDTRDAMAKAVECGVWRVSPEAEEAIREAIHSYHHGRSPVQPLNDIQAIAWLDDQDSIECKKTFRAVTKNGRSFTFEAGHSYPLLSETVRYSKPETRRRIRGGQREKEVVQVRGYDLRLTVGEHIHFYHNPKRCDAEAYSLQDLVDHFVIPKVPDIAELNPEEYQANLDRCDAFEQLTR